MQLKFHAILKWSKKKKNSSFLNLPMFCALQKSIIQLSYDKLKNGDGSVSKLKGMFKYNKWGKHFW